jgi:hypothetical protein
MIFDLFIVLQLTLVYPNRCIFERKSVCDSVDVHILILQYRISNDKHVPNHSQLETYFLGLILNVTENCHRGSY